MVNTLPKLSLVMILTVLFFCSFNSEAQEAADWWKTHQDAKAVLLDQRIPIAELVEKVSVKKPENAQEAMFKINIFMRAGMNKEAIEALHELKSLNPQIDNPQISGIYYDACDDFAAWDVARAIVEIFADNISELSLDNRSLEHFTRSGWTFEQIDAWLLNKPGGIDNFWLKQRLTFNARYGKTDELVKKLSDVVRSNPQDIERAISFLNALKYVGQRSFETLVLS